jgi:hypothetical protein
MNEPRPRFLAPITKPRDYVDRPELAVRNEPECVGPAILESYATASLLAHSQRHIMEVSHMRENVRPLLRAEDRIRDAERRARQARRRDLKGEFQALRGMLARYQKTNDEPKPDSSLIGRLERVEARLDGLDQAA